MICLLPQEYDIVTVNKVQNVLIILQLLWKFIQSVCLSGIIEKSDFLKKTLFIILLIINATISFIRITQLLILETGFFSRINTDLGRFLNCFEEFIAIYTNKKLIVFVLKNFGYQLKPKKVSNQHH